MAQVEGQQSRRPSHVVLIGYVAAGYFAINSLIWPLGNDQALFALVGRTILTGGFPYKNTWEIKGPLTHYIYAAALAIWHMPALSTRILDAIFVFGFALCLRQLARRLPGVSTLTADWASASFVLTYYSMGFWQTAQPDGWGGMLVALAVLLMLSPTPRATLRMSCVGALIGVAALLKPTFIPFVVLPLLYPVTSPDPYTNARWRRSSCLGGFSIAIALPLAIWLQATGTAEDAADVVRYLFSGYVPHRSRASDYAIILLYLPFLPILFLVAPVGLWKQHGERLRRQGRVLSLWLAITIFIVVAQGRYFPYHLIPAVIAALVPVSMVLGDVDRYARMRRWPYVSSALVLVTFAIQSAPLILPAIPVNHYEDIEAKQERLASYVAGHSDEHDSILMWGELVSVYLLSNRVCPTRFATSQPLITKSSCQSKYRRIFIEELQARPPRYVIIDTSHWLFGYEESGLDFLSEFPQFNLFVHSHYMLVDSVDEYQIWKFHN